MVETLIFLLIIVVIVARIGKSINGSSPHNARMIEESWLRIPDLINDRNGEAEGEWLGFYSSSQVDEAGLPEDLKDFSVTISVVDTTIAGSITDSYGTDNIVGIVDFPRVRFIRKSILKDLDKHGYLEKPTMKCFSGNISLDKSTISGSCYLNPFEKWRLRGDFKLTRKGEGSEVALLELKEAEKASLKPAILAAPAENEVESENEKEYVYEIAPEAKTDVQMKPVADVQLSAAEELKKMAEENKNLLFKAQEKESDPAIFEPTPIKGAIKCPHCDAETSASFDFCLYCSKTIKAE